MKVPWSDKTGTSKLIAIFATGLLISLGLCGLNFFAVIRFVPLSGPGPKPGRPYPPQWPGRVLSITGVLELVCIAFFAVGLLAVLISRTGKWRDPDRP